MVGEASKRRNIRFFKKNSETIINYFLSSSFQKQTLGILLLPDRQYRAEVTKAFGFNCSVDRYILKKYLIILKKKKK